MPKVTVLMAVYNGDRYLREAIESILAQTFQDFEFLIINDGSTDSTKEVLLSYNDPRIRLVDNGHNLGLTRSLNKGLALAEGRFIARQDADDISEPERLARQVAFLETHPEVALVGTWYKEIDDRGNSIGDRELPCDSTQIRWDLLFYCPFVHSSVMFCKSTVLEQIGFYDEAFIYAQDYDLWSRIARCLLVANLNECLMKLRLNPSSMTATYGSIVDDEALQITIANMGHLLNWDKTKIGSHRVQPITMASLLTGYQNQLNLQEVNRAIEEILHLHSAFCQFYKIERRDCRTQLVKLCTHISYRLIEQAHCYFHQNNFAALQLLEQAYRLHWPVLFTKRHLRLVLKLVMGSRLVRAVRHPTQKELGL